jgi:hypothetical protein
MSIADDVRVAGAFVRQADGATLDRAIAGFIGRFVAPAFSVSCAAIEDSDGVRTGTFAAVVHTDELHDGVVRADDAAVAIYAVEKLDIACVRDGYAALVHVKQLRKTRVSSGEVRTNRTLTILLAQQSDLPMETLAEEVERLNAATPDPAWPDVVVVADTGTIQYAIQFPGEGLGGDFLPPAETALQNLVPPMYVVLVLKPAGAWTLNRVLAFLICHLQIFKPDAALQRWDGLVDGVSNTGVVMTGYQYTYAGALVPVRPEMYIGRYIAPPPLEMRAPDGEVLGTVEYIPWQDGGVLRMQGKFPLDALLVFVGPMPKKVASMKRPDAELSLVLPMSEGGFHALLRTFEERSNLVVREPEVNWVIQKAADEGSESPFMARMMIGVFRLRDAVYKAPDDRTAFDTKYGVATAALFTARSAAQVVEKVWTEHACKVASGEVARLEGRIVRVDESIEQELRKQVETFLNASVRAVKQGMHDLGRTLGVEIGFLFQKQSLFDAGVAALDASDAPLAAYLRATRAAWSETLVQRRNAIEHTGWVLPQPMYRAANGGVIVVEPEIDGRRATEYVASMLDRVTCFGEEFTTHCLQRLLPQDVTVTEIPRAARVEVMPERFSLTLAVGGLAPWTIAYHMTTFEES